MTALCWVLEMAHTATCIGVRCGLHYSGRLLARIPWSCRLGALLAAAGALSVNVGTFGSDWLFYARGLDKAQLQMLRDSGLVSSFGQLCVLAVVFGFVQIVASLLAFVRCRYSLLVHKIATAAFVVLWCYLLFFLMKVPGALYAFDDDAFWKMERNEWWVRGVGLWLVPALWAAGTVLCLALRSVQAFYTGREPAVPLVGDKVVEDLKTHGGDPRFRTSSYWAAFAHIFVLFIIPFVLGRGCEESPYGLPKGSGNPIVEIVKIKKVKKKKKDEVILNLDSPILFYRPKLDDSKVLEELLDETLATYQATPLKGKLGKGGGKGGGWPQGMENARVRFIRLEYGGGDWDQQMGKGADYNFLVQFSKLTGFKIAEATESRPIRQLKRFPAKKAPPFVFITGAGSISVTPRDMKTLRWYCLEEGGMIFADNGGGHFNSSFRTVMQRVFPELDWVDIASDDAIFRQPYLFPNGAPPLWHHSGTRAMGLKHNGRWIVFYHQGDLNDAWQDGHSGVSEELASQAYKIGVNVVNYAFNKYYERHYE